MSTQDKIRFHIEELQRLTAEAIELTGMPETELTGKEKRLVRAITSRNPDKIFRHLALYYVAQDIEDIDETTQQAFFDVLAMLNEFCEEEK